MKSNDTDLVAMNFPTIVQVYYSEDWSLILLVAVSAVTLTDSLDVPCSAAKTRFRVMRSEIILVFR